MLGLDLGDGAELSYRLCLYLKRMGTEDWDVVGVSHPYVCQRAAKYLGK